MADYARVNSQNIVIYVTPIPDEMITDENGHQYEHRALAHLYKTIPDSTNDRWIRTFSNGSNRIRFASVGFTYDETLDAFIPPKPFESWILNEITADWEPPVPKPDDGNFYEWDEEILSWVSPIG